MKRIVVSFLMFLFFVPLVFAGSLSIGDKILLDDYKMNCVFGQKVSIADVKKENGVVVIFSSNVCPFVQAWESRYIELKTWADTHKVGMIAVNSNYGGRDNGDSFDDMKKRSEEKNYNFAYVIDEDSRIANAFGGQTTPHVFVFDKEMKLVYKGVIDDNYKSASEVKNSYAKVAVASLANAAKIEVAQTKPLGCGIKRKLD